MRQRVGHQLRIMGGHGKSRKNVKRGQKVAVRESGDCGCGTSGSHHHRPKANGDHQGGVSESKLKKMLSIVPISSLRREIFVTELEVDTRHENRVLSGTFCVEPFVINCVHTVLEDKFGNTVRVLIDDDGVITSTQKSKVLARYAKGRCVHIFEPYLKVSLDGGTVVSVDDYRDIGSDDPCEEEEKLPLAICQANGVPSAPESTHNASAEVDSIRCKGNVLFAEQDWKGALRFYSECITKCLVLIKSIKGLDTPINGTRLSDENTNLSKTLLLAYSNRSETWLRYRIYDEAQSDASKALELDSKHVKSLVRNGKALYELQQYEESSACFSAALQESPDDSTIKVALARSRTSHTQSRDGVYDLTDYYVSCCSRQPPSCSDFVGPVEIRQPAGGMRGLFATKHIAAGELLLVSNAIAVCHNDKHQSDSDDEGCGACEACEKQKVWAHKEFGRKNARYVDELVGKLTLFARSSKRRMYQVAVLAGTKPTKNPPISSMDLFRPGSDWTPPSTTNLQLDLDTMRDIVRNNSIDEILNDPRYFMCGESEQLLSALWLLPSIMNHSCCANSETWLVGEAMFVRACRPIASGEELTRSYFDTLKGLERREEVAKRWPFKCRCQRCEWESSIPEPHNKIRKKLCARVHRFFFEAYATPFTPNLEKLASLVTSVEETIQSVGLEGKFRLWIRASLMDAYIANIHVLVGIPTRRIEAIRTVLDAMIEVGGGLALRPQIASTLLREVKRKYGKASPVFRSTETYVMEVYKPFYGELSKKAFWTLAKMHAGGDGMD